MEFLIGFIIGWLLVRWIIRRAEAHEQHLLNRYKGFEKGGAYDRSLEAWRKKD